MMDYCALEHHVADSYIAELIKTGNPLVTRPDGAADRHQSALEIARDVLADLHGAPRVAPPPAEVHKVWADLDADPDRLRGAVTASAILFRCALQILSARTHFDEQKIAISLHERLWQDVSAAAQAGMTQRSTLLALDTRRLPVRLTRTQTRIAAALAHNLTTDEICAKLHISKRTLENHIGHISDKTGGRGRRGILASLHAAQAIIAVPVIVLGGVLSEGILSLQDML